MESAPVPTPGQDSPPAVPLLGDDPIDVIVFQMGKVGSVALCASLEAAGVSAIQTHFLGEAKLKQMLDRLINPATNSFVLGHGVGQLVQNIQLTNHVNAYRAASLRAPDQPLERRLRLITVARDPRDWYRSNLVQNFEGIIQDVERFGAANGSGAGGDARELLSEHLARIEQVVGASRAPFGTPGHLQEVAALTRSYAEPELLRRHVQEYLRPIVWFDAFLLPALSLDVFSAPFDHKRGAARIENAFADALVLKFETHDLWEQNVSGFLGVDGFKLLRANESNGKDAYDLVKEVWNARPANPACDRRVRATRYARHFGYDG